MCSQIIIRTSTTECTNKCNKIRPKIIYDCVLPVTITGTPTALDTVKVVDTVVPPFNFCKIFLFYYYKLQNYNKILKIRNLLETRQKAGLGKKSLECQF